MGRARVEPVDISQLFLFSGSMMVYRHKLIPTWLSSTFELLHVYSCVRFFFCRGGMVQTAEQYEFIHRGLCLFELTLADWSQNFKPMAAENLQQCKKKKMNGASSKALPMKLIGRWWVADKYSRGITFPRRGRWNGANDRASLFSFCPVTDQSPPL